MFMRKTLGTAVASLALALPSAQAAQSSVAEEVTTTVVESSNQFGLDVMAELLRNEEADANVFYSPVSANLALSMLMAGAQGPTLAQMQSTMRLPATLSETEIHQANSVLMDSLQKEREGLTISLANSLWADNSFPIRAQYADLVTSMYDATVANVDFQANAAQVAGDINQWASESTNERIQQVVSADSVRDLVMLLANATYFKGTWLVEFDKEETLANSTFRKDSGEMVSVDMMKRDRQPIEYFENGYQAVRLPFKGEDSAMYVVLPPAGIDESAKEWMADNATSPVFWSEVLEGLTTQKVNLSLPKFKFKYSKYLNETLQTLGMGGIFGSPDFSALSEQRTRVSFVKQDSFIQVDEEGAEAAAVTTIGLERTSAQPDPVYNFTADRPFMIAIRDDATNTLLFIGAIAEPVWEE